MKPSSFHEVSPQCCLTCRFSGEKRGIMSLLCFYGEPEELEDYNPPPLEEGELDDWWVKRVTDDLGMCDEYEPAKTR